ncbi:hypothetical protein ACFX2J_031226 [Malus domestica]
MKDLGEAKKILDMEITRNHEKGLVYLTQKQYFCKLLQRFGVNDATKPGITPMALYFKLSALLSLKNNEEKLLMKNILYFNLVGGLMYTMVCSRPDIAHVVGLQSDSNFENFVVGYVDFDYAGDLDKRRSTTSYLFTMAKGPVSWRFALQSTVALSITEAEYMVIAEIVKEAIGIHGLIKTLGIYQKQVELHCDSQSAIYLSKYQVYHSRTRHIDVRFHFIHEILSKRKIIFQKVTIADNPADMLTKGLELAKFEHCLNIAHILCA